MRKALLLLCVLLVFASARIPTAYGWDLSSLNIFGGSDGTPEIPDFKLGYVPTVHSIDPVVISKLYGPNFERSKLEVVKFGSWGELIDALRSGSVQGASIPAALEMEAAEEGAPIKIISKSHRHGNALIVAKDIATIEGLKGKKVAVSELPSTHTVLLYRALGNDTGLGGIKIVVMTPEEMSSALSSGEIKGYVADQYYGAKDVLAGKGRMLYRSQDVWKNETSCVLVMRSDFIERYPKAVQEFVDGYVGSGFFIDKNHNMTVPTCGDQIKMDRKTMDLCFKWGVSYASLRPVRADLAYLYDSLVRLKLLKGTLDLNSTLDDSFISTTYRNSELLASCG